MKKIWNFILKYRIYILIFILLIVGVFGFMIVKAYLHPEDESVIYGDRLDGRDELPITKDKKQKIVKVILENENLTSASIDVQGKIINISITAATKENNIDVLKEISTELLSNFSEEEIAFYDFQFFIKNVDANYNMIGYKNKNSTLISWTSDEIVSEVEDNEDEKE